MAAPANGTVVLVRFPFSDLSGAKMRPAVVLAQAGRGDAVLCQITSRPYADSSAVEITATDIKSGSLNRTSYIRPGKLFTANQTIITRSLGEIEEVKFAAIIGTVIALFEASVNK